MAVEDSEPSSSLRAVDSQSDFFLMGSEVEAQIRFFAALKDCPGVRIAPTVLRTDCGILSICPSAAAMGHSQRVTVKTKREDGASLFKVAAELIYDCKRPYDGNWSQSDTQDTRADESSSEPFIWLKIAKAWEASMSQISVQDAARGSAIINLSATSEQFLRMVELERRRLQYSVQPNSVISESADAMHSDAMSVSSCRVPSPKVLGEQGAEEQVWLVQHNIVAQPYFRVASSYALHHHRASKRGTASVKLVKHTQSQSHQESEPVVSHYSLTVHPWTKQSKATPWPPSPHPHTSSAQGSDDEGTVGNRRPRPKEWRSVCAGVEACTLAVIKHLQQLFEVQGLVLEFFVRQDAGGAGECVLLGAAMATMQPRGKIWKQPLERLPHALLLNSRHGAAAKEKEKEHAEDPLSLRERETAVVDRVVRGGEESGCEGMRERGREREERDRERERDVEALWPMPFRELANATSEQPSSAHASLRRGRGHTAAGVRRKEGCGGGVAHLLGKDEEIVLLNGDAMEVIVVPRGKPPREMLRYAIKWSRDDVVYWYLIQ